MMISLAMTEKVHLPLYEILRFRNRQLIWRMPLAEQHAERLNPVDKVPPPDWARTLINPDDHEWRPGFDQFSPRSVTEFVTIVNECIRLANAARRGEEVKSQVITELSPASQPRGVRRRFSREWRPSHAQRGIGDRVLGRKKGVGRERWFDDGDGKGYTVVRMWEPGVV